MVRSYTARYTKIASGYMGQVVEWPEVITEGKAIEECRVMLRDALQEMMQAYRQQGKQDPIRGRPRGAGGCRGIACRSSIGR
jgi:predicted RNase H-like HicB family nuclease